MPTFKSYFTGFILSILATLAAYFAVINHSAYALLVIVALAVIQLFVQLVFFLHIGHGENARLRWAMYLFTLVVVGIVVGGSLWIMSNLDYNMTPDQMNAAMLDQAE